VSSIAEDPAADPRLSVEDVQRTAEEDEEFGIAHLRAHGAEGVTSTPGETHADPGHVPDPGLVILCMGGRARDQSTFFRCHTLPCHAEHAKVAPKPP